MKIFILQKFTEWWFLTTVLEKIIAGFREEIQPFFLQNLDGSLVEVNITKSLGIINILPACECMDVALYCIVRTGSLISRRKVNLEGLCGSHYNVAKEARLWTGRRPTWMKNTWSATSLVEKRGCCTTWVGRRICTRMMQLHNIHEINVNVTKRECMEQVYKFQNLVCIKHNIYEMKVYKN